MRCVQGFTAYAVHEVVPLWLISEKDLGGLQMTAPRHSRSGFRGSTLPKSYEHHLKS